MPCLIRIKTRELIKMKEGLTISSDDTIGYEAAEQEQTDMKNGPTIYQDYTMGLWHLWSSGWMDGLVRFGFGF